MEKNGKLPAMEKNGKPVRMRFRKGVAHPRGPIRDDEGAAGSKEMEEDRNPAILQQLESDPAASVEKLHTDLWGVILCLLPVNEYVRSGVVCRLWRRATTGRPHRLNAKTPWVMFPGSDDPGSFRFFNIADLTPCSLGLPQLRGKRIDGYSHGYIIVSSPTEILLLDPFVASSEVRFPPPTIVDFYNGQLEHPHIEKLIFSPSLSTAAAICGGHYNQRHCLSLARVGKASWTMFRHKNYIQYCDVIVHKGEFYILDSKGLLLSFDPSPSTGRKMNFRRHGYGVNVSNHDYRMYLAESLDGDHLLLVCRMMDEKSRMTNSFKIFRQDMVGRRWQWVEVGSLGVAAIFVGNNYSTCIFTRGFPELRGNCVYFTEDRTLQQTRDDFGVFNLGDGSIQHLVALQHILPSKPSPPPSKLVYGEPIY